MVPLSMLARRLAIRDETSESVFNKLKRVGQPMMLLVGPGSDDAQG